ncbi:hypothetical protein KP509_30G061700 [Ceratopteris richardii]|uniref:Membrane protein insertion efficiency factor n=1 Tax=Ceratopteris richardii TaxID=49495 RepID=A0A8T2R4L9_CERRI|nr:hypothetical protein KP509_30G061700 [Ceratopteris richardii]
MSTSRVVAAQLIGCPVPIAPSKRQIAIRFYNTDHKHSTRFFHSSQIILSSFNKRHSLEFRNPCQLECFCCNKSIDGEEDPGGASNEDNDAELSFGVNIALAMLKFYRMEISPFLPSSCRFIPTCSEYSMQAYKKYGIVKGTILTAWRLLRCNPLGPSGFDPPRWFGESTPPQ